VVDLLGARLQPGAQRLEHLVFLAAPEGAVQPPEVGAAGVSGEADRGAQGPADEVAVGGGSIYSLCNIITKL
jgi:hypothetical protein